MKTFDIGSDAAGQRLDRYLLKRMPGAGKGLIQKSLRKKNITLNGKKAQPQDIVCEGDCVAVYFSDATFEKFAPQTKTARKFSTALETMAACPVFENDDFAAYNKPAGTLTQPDRTGDESVAEIAAARFYTPGSTFHPAPLNRLDRGTSGLILIPKTYAAQKKAAAALRTHTAKKLYTALVRGTITEPGTLEHAYKKDSAQNKASVSESGAEQPVRLSYRPLWHGGDATLLEVALETGKSHQIRVQLAAAGHPIIGDSKYGDKNTNAAYKKRFGLTRQLLHAGAYTLKDEAGDVLIEARAPLPEDFKTVLDGLGAR